MTIDCDIHPGVPNIKALLPYMDEFWQESFVARGIDGFDMMSYPLGAPITCRPDWRVKGERPGLSLANMQRDALDAFGISLAICNPLTGGQVAVSESMGAALCSAVNDWIVEHWLDKEPRLRASIVIPPQAPLMAVEEIERLAGDKRFVQILMPAACEIPSGIVENVCLARFTPQRPSSSATAVPASDKINPSATTVAARRTTTRGSSGTPTTPRRTPR